jgi:hypothetical protein
MAACQSSQVRKFFGRMLRRETNQVPRPDCRRRVDQETPRETGKTISHQLEREGKRDLVAEILCPILVKEGGDSLNDNDIGRISDVEGHVCHDSDQHVLLLVEGTGVETEFADEGECELFRGHHTCPASTEGCEELA